MRCRWWRGSPNVVSGFSVIGEARNALSAAGWTATITANRITVDEDVLAQFIPAKVGAFGLISACWLIYSIAGTTSVDRRNHQYDC